LLAAGSTKMAAYRAAYPGDYNDRSCSAKAARLSKHALIAPLEAGRAARVRDAVAVAVGSYGITAERVADPMARLAFTELRQIVDVHSVVVGGQRRQDQVEPSFHVRRLARQRRPEVFDASHRNFGFALSE
jgi:hypothetical protein